MRNVRDLERYIFFFYKGWGLKLNLPFILCWLHVRQSTEQTTAETKHSRGRRGLAIRPEPLSARPSDKKHKHPRYLDGMSALPHLTADILPRDNGITVVVSEILRHSVTVCLTSLSTHPACLSGN